MKKIITGLCFLLATATMQLCAQQGLADSDLFNKISMIKAIDNHAHPLKYITKDGKPDDEYDALPLRLFVGEVAIMSCIFQTTLGVICHRKQ